jgi:hypothetical protein
MPKRSTAGGKAKKTTGNPLAALLASRLAEQGREPGAPVTVAALCKTLLPYRACRDALGVASKGEYDVALLRFMHGGDVLSLDQELTKAVEGELANPEPGLAFLKNFAAAKVAVDIGPDSLEREQVDLDRESPDDLDDLLGVTSTKGNDESEEVPDEPIAEAEQTMSRTTSEDAVRCPQCNEEFPQDREVLFCPFCGHDQSVLLCAQCGEELSVRWRFCPRCGTAAERS